MLYGLWKWIQLWLPYGFIIWLYRRNKALPANLKTKEGNNYKAIMVTEDYGVVFSDTKYIQNRGRFLMEQKRRIEQENNAVISELNSLNMEAREEIYRGNTDGSI